MNWRAKYINGETVTEEDGVSSDRLNRAMLQEFSIMDGDLPIHTIELSPNRKFFYRKRVSIKPGFGENTIHLVGYREDGSWDIAVVHMDHRVEKANAFIKNHPYLYSPRFLPHEELK